MKPTIASNLLCITKDDLELEVTLPLPAGTGIANVSYYNQLEHFLLLFYYLNICEYYQNILYQKHTWKTNALVLCTFYVNNNAFHHFTSYNSMILKICCSIIYKQKDCICLGI